MKLNKENFVKDELFQELIEMEDIYLEYEPSEYSIFVLEDGTVVNSLFYLGVRITPHHSILQQDDWIIERLITIEPETHTVILPIKQQMNNLNASKHLKIFGKMFALLNNRSIKATF